MAATQQHQQQSDDHTADTSSPSTATSPNIQQFITILKPVQSWFTLGVLLGLPTTDLRLIEIKCQVDPHRSLVELYGALDTQDRVPTWSDIMAALHTMDEHKVARDVDIQYCGSSQGVSSALQDSPLPQEVPDIEEVDHVDVPARITQDFERINEKFCCLVADIIKRLERIGGADLQDLKRLVQELLKLSPPITESDVTIDQIFSCIRPHYSCLNYGVLMNLVNRFLKTDHEIKHSFSEYESRIRSFKTSTKMKYFVKLLNKKSKPSQAVNQSSRMKVIRLKTRTFWGEVTTERFETAMNQIMVNVYKYSSNLSVDDGCFVISWTVPHYYDSSMIDSSIKLDDFETLNIIGIISLAIDESIVFESSPNVGCESIKAAMLQAIELKNTRAIELLLAVGCSPQVATYTDSNTVTNIVNIRAIESEEGSSGSSGGVDNVCILGHNKHVEAIIDPSREPECDSCSVKEKMIKQLHQEVDGHRSEAKTHIKKNEELVSEVELQSKEIERLKSQEFVETSLHMEEQLKLKVSEIQLLSNSCRILAREKMSKEMEILRMKEENSRLQSVLSTLCDSSTVELPCRWRHLGLRAEMKGRVITRDKDGKKLVTGGSVVRAILTCNANEECPVTDNNDGTYTITVIPQRLGQHQLSITVNGKYIQGSPFTLNIVPQRDYTTIGQMVKTMSGFNYPRRLAFNANGDMFIVSYGDHCVYVYTKDGRKERVIGSMGTGQVQFEFPHGIDIVDDGQQQGGVIYIAEKKGNRIHQLTTNGEFKGTFGEEGSAIGQFDSPYDVKISPVDGKVYVADGGNNRIQVFDPDSKSISHVIDGGNRFSSPQGIAFDLTGNVHVTGFKSSSVSVFSPHDGHFLRCYGDSTNIINPTCIAIDPSGYSLVTLYGNSSLSIFDPNGSFVYSLGGFYRPYGVAVSPDDTVWVVDTMNRRLAQY